MTVSIVTPCYNAADTIADTLESVLGQSGVDLQYIVVDGKSSDGTAEVIARYRDRISTFVSERDAGPYHAMNKGLHLARGDVVGILNADDVYADSSSLRRVMDRFQSSDIEALYGNLAYVDRKDPARIVRYWKPGEHTPGSFSRGWHPPHPTFFVRRAVYDRCGYLQPDFQVSADFELMLRILEKYRVRAEYLDELIVRMRTGGLSNRSLANIIVGNRNCIRAFRSNGLAVSPWYPLLRLAPKLRQFGARRGGGL